MALLRSMDLGRSQERKPTRLGDKLGVEGAGKKHVKDDAQVASHLPRDYESSIM